MIRSSGQAIISLIVVCTLSAGAAAAPGDLADRWNLADLYASPVEWEAAKVAFEGELETIDRCRGKLGDSAALLKECIDNVFRITRDFQRIYSYAAMSSDIDIRTRSSLSRA